MCCCVNLGLHINICVQQCKNAWLWYCGKLLKQMLILGSHCWKRSAGFSYLGGTPFLTKLRWNVDVCQSSLLCYWPAWSPLLLFIFLHLLLFIHLRCVQWLFHFGIFHLTNAGWTGCQSEGELRPAALQSNVIVRGSFGCTISCLVYQLRLRVFGIH